MRMRGVILRKNYARGIIESVIGWPPWCEDFQGGDLMDSGKTTRISRKISMKKIFTITLLLAVVLLSCDLGYTKPDYVTFDEVSQPYFDRYGQPEDVYTYDSGNYQSVSWWWWSKGFNVDFVRIDWTNWKVGSTYTFEPID